MTKKYRLMKDLPDCKAGVVYNLGNDGVTYICLSNMGEWSVCYPKERVENNPEWFQEILPESSKDVTAGLSSYLYASTVLNRLYQAGLGCWSSMQKHFFELEMKNITKLIELEQYNFPRQKAAEKHDWEVVAYKVPYMGCNDVEFVKRKDGRFYGRTPTGFGNNYAEQTISLEPKSKIHSVRRLSDGEVFTVGDYLTELGRYSNENHPIKSMELINGTIGLNYGNGGAIIIQAAKKYSPQPSKERIEVTVSGASWQNDKAGMLVVNLGETYISGEKIPAIKEAIEKILNQ